MTNLYMVKLYMNNIEAFKTYINKINPNLKYDLDKIKEKISDTVEKLAFQLKDIKTSTEFRTCYQDHENILNVIKGYIKTYDTIEQVLSLKSFINMLHTEPFDSVRQGDLISLAYDYFYESSSVTEMPLGYNNHLYRTITNINGLNIFAPNCSNGKNIAEFAKEKDSTFGNSNSYVSQAKERMTRVIKGKLKGSFISNNFFDVLYIIPQISYALQTDPFGKIKEPEEKILIKNCIKYCRQNGVIIITIPATRIDKNFAFYLSKVLGDNAQITRVPNDSLERITIIGQKQITNKPKQELYEKLQYIDYDLTPMPEDLVPVFEIPTEQLTLELFRGSTLDIDDVLEATQTNLIDAFLENQTQPLVVKDQSPLLPFNIGQVGLVLTSGCLDGIVEEVDGVYHVIKGMTTKLSTTHTEVSDNNQEVKSTETISNQVKINVFTGDGEFISLG